MKVLLAGDPVYFLNFGVRLQFGDCKLKFPRKHFQQNENLYGVPSIAWSK